MNARHARLGELLLAAKSVDAGAFNNRVAVVMFTNRGKRDEFVAMTRAARVEAGDRAGVADGFAPAGEKR